MQATNNFLLALDGLLGASAWFPWLLLGVGIFFTLYLGFPQIRYFRRGWHIVRGRYDHSGMTGDTSHFQALTTALSCTVGTGNIGGVGLAIYLGGPAALFWMWITAFVGMTTKFVEVTLSCKYREKTDDGTMAGGPMYFMDKALNMKWLAVFFAVATLVCAFGTGNMPQVNNIADAMEASFGIEPVITGGVLTLLLALVILGGIGRIARVTAALIPLMSVVYLVGALAVILYNIDNCWPSLAAVFEDAFSGTAATGGFLGASFAYAFNRGVNRGLFSNGAGQGSAPIAHAAARADEPVSEGMVSILEPFIDTILICTLTGMVILSSGVWTEKHHNRFQRADIQYVQGHYSDLDGADRQALFRFLSGQESQVRLFSGVVEVTDGKATTEDFTLVASRSVAEQVRYSVDGHPYSGRLEIAAGRPVDDAVTIEGRSLLHSAELVTKAFSRGYFGEFGEYLIAISLLMFAFSTAIAWAYFGDRAVIYLFGPRWVMPFRVLYVAGFMLAVMIDTTVVWNLAAVSIVLMTLPNLIGMLLLARDMKQTVAEYWRESPDAPRSEGTKAGSR